LITGRASASLKRGIVTNAAKRTWEKGDEAKKKA
jgi:hypothetical protein